MRRLSARLISDIAFSFGVVFLVVYFAYAALHGDHGVARLVETETLEMELHLELAGLEQDRMYYENLTRRLSDQYLDLDLLDQQARDRLGLIRPDEILIR